MAGMLRALTLATALLVTVPCTGHLVAPDAARAETIADALKRQEALSRLVETWLSLAARDEREDKIDEYSKYKDEDWKNPKRDVEAKDLVAVLADPKADITLRQRAAKVLEEAAISSRDPDLVPDKRNDISRRKRWAKQHLLGLTVRPDEKGGDAVSRLLAFNLLKSWFQPPNSDASDISNYDPAANKKDSWGPAHKVFREVLNR